MSAKSKNFFKSKRVMLRPINPDDYHILFEMHTNPENMYLWWHDRYIFDFEAFINDFRSRLSSFIDSFFIIDKIINKDRIIIGFIYSYKANHIDKHAYICLYLIPEYTSDGLGPEAGTLFCKYLFRTFGYRKLYMEIFAYNSPSIKLVKKNNFIEEAVLKDYRYYDDRYWDLHIFSVSKEALMP